MGLTGGSLVVPLIVSIALLLGALYVLNRMQSRKEPVDYSQVKF